MTQGIPEHGPGALISWVWWGGLDWGGGAVKSGGQEGYLLGVSFGSIANRNTGSTFISFALCPIEVIMVQIG